MKLASKEDKEKDKKEDIMQEELEATPTFDEMEEIGKDMTPELW